MTTVRRPMPREECEGLIAAGHEMEDRGEFEGALACYQKAIDADPKSPRAHMNVANAYQRLERWDRATEALEHAIECDPEFAPAHFNVGLLLNNRGKSREAEAELLEALRLKPSMLEAMLILADLYEVSGRFDEAERYYDRALELAPNHPGALLNYGMYCSRRRRFDEAMDCFHRVKTIEPGFRDVESIVLFSLNFRTDVDVHSIANGHRRVGAAISKAAGPAFTTWSNAPNTDRPIRVGYVSGDFLTHPVAVLLRPVLEHHDRQHFNTFCYSNYPEANPVADFLRERSQHWREISSMSDNDVVELLRRDEIDILVDLSGHTARHRLPVFARHPAPVQVTWLGYLNTTGLPAMDYRICDPFTDPVGSSEQLSTEELVRMPHSQWCYVPWHDREIAAEPRSAHPNAVVFGSFNQDRKISDECLAVWSRILARVPDAELLVLDFPQPPMQKLFLERAARAGIDPRRVSARGRETIAQYFNTMSNVDIALDTYPYNGATTTLDTLWMGVPIVALRGERGISRSGYSILKTLGADELIAETPDEYIALNVRLALDKSWRNRLRTSLRMRLERSPLMDPAGFTEALEDRYREMWRTWCSRHSAEAPAPRA